MIITLENNISYELSSIPNSNIFNLDTLKEFAEICLENELYVDGWRLENEYKYILNLQEKDIEGELAFHKFLIKKDSIKVPKYLILLIFTTQEIVKEETNKKSKHSIVEYEEVLLGCMYCKRREIMFYMKEEYRNKGYMSEVYQDFIDNFPEFKFHYNTTINEMSQKFLSKNNIKHKIG